MYADSRWPWALLEGAYDGKKEDLDMKSIVMALAGEELTSISGSDADEYCAASPTQALVFVADR